MLDNYFAKNQKLIMQTGNNAFQKQKDMKNLI